MWQIARPTCGLILLISWIYTGLGASVSRGESAGRISERITSHWRPPNAVEYFEFIRIMEKTTKSKQGIAREKTLAAVKKLLNQSNINQATRAGLMVRLASLYTESAFKERERVLKVFRTKYDKWLDEQPVLVEEQPVIDLRSVNAYVKKAIQAYRDLFNAFPKFNNDPSVIYRMANLQLLMKSSNAVLYFEKLAKQFGKTSWGRKSVLGLAEYHLNKNDLKKAKYLLGVVIKKSKLVGYTQYAEYRLGWIHAMGAFRGGQISKSDLNLATSYFRKLATKASGPKSFRRSKAANYLKKNAMNDLIWLWSNAYDFNAGKGFFYNGIKSKITYHNFLERLAWKYQNANNLTKSASFYRLIFSQYPDRRHHMRLHLRLIDLLFKNRKPLDVLRELGFITNFYSNKKGKWYRRNNRNSKHMGVVRAKILDQLIQKGNYYYSQYRREKLKSSLQAANGIFAIFVKAFPNESNSNEMRFKLAQTLELLAKLPDSVRQYYLVANAKETPVSVRKISAYKMVSLQEKVVAKSKFPPFPKGGSVKSPLNIPKQKKNFLDIGKTFVSLYPSDSKSTDLLFKSAKILFNYGHYKQAIQRFQDTVKQSPNSSLSKSSVQVVLSFFEQRKSWTELTLWCELFIKFDRQLGVKISRYIIGKLRNAMWQIALAYNAAKKYQNAAEAFLKYQKRLPKDARADQALFHATNLFYKIGNGKQGILIGLNLNKTYPRSKYGADTTYGIAIAHQNLNNYRLAAETFETFSSRFSKDKRAPQALYQGGQIYRGLKNHDRTALLLTALSNRYPSSAYAPKAVLETAEINLLLDQEDKAVELYRHYIRKYKSINPETTFYARAQAAVLPLRRTPQNVNMPEVIGLERELKGRPRIFAKKARVAISGFFFEVLHGMTTDFKQQKVAYYDFNEYQTSIRNYLNHLVGLEKVFLRLVGMTSVEMVTEAYYKLGLVYERGLADFSAKWNMDGLREADATQILDAKERQVFELRGKMTKSFVNSYELAKRTKFLLRIEMMR